MEEDDSTIPQRVVHEALNQHVWSERTNRKTQCDRCCRWDPHECDCGARRCKQCLLPDARGTRPTCRWQQHPTRPLPFSVQDHLKWPDDEKVAWICQEIGEGAGLDDFARKWMDLFSGKIHGEVAQKAACMKLYAMYSPPKEGRAWRCESDLPPDVLAPFQRIWNPDAPDRCLECSKPVSRRSNCFRVLGQPCCSQQCMGAGCVVVGKYCGNPMKNQKFAGCSTCKWGLWRHDWPAPPIHWPTEGIAEMTDEQRRRRAWQMGVWWKLDKAAEQVGQRMRWLHCRVEHPRDYAQAWKRRRRS